MTCLVVRILTGKPMISCTQSEVRSEPTYSLLCTEQISASYCTISIHGLNHEMLCDAAIIAKYAIVSMRSREEGKDY